MASCWLPCARHGARDLIAIVDWRTGRNFSSLGVDVRLNTYADAADVLAESPDVVIVATGGLPDTDWLEGCRALQQRVGRADRRPARRCNDVIVYDGTGRHQAVSCALHLAEHGSSVQFVTIDDNIGLEMEYSARVVYRKRFALNGVKSLIDHRLSSVRKKGNQLVATFRHELTGATTELTASQVVIERGTVPVDEMFHALRAASANDGVTDIDALLERQTQPVARAGIRPAPHRRCRQQPQRAWRDLRRAAAVQRAVEARRMTRRACGKRCKPRDLPALHALSQRRPAGRTAYRTVAMLLSLGEGSRRLRAGWRDRSWARDAMALVRVPARPSAWCWWHKRSRAKGLGRR